MEPITESLGPRVSRPSLVRGDFAVFLEDSVLHKSIEKFSLWKCRGASGMSTNKPVFQMLFSSLTPGSSHTLDFSADGGTSLLCTGGVLCVLLKGLCSSRGSPLPHHVSLSVIIRTTCSVCVEFIPIGFWTNEKPGTEAPVCMTTEGRGSSRSYCLP